MRWWSVLQRRTPSQDVHSLLFQKQFCLHLVFWHNKSTQLVNIIGFIAHTRCTCSSHSEERSLSWGSGFALLRSTLLSKSSGSGSTLGGCGSSTHSSSKSCAVNTALFFVRGGEQCSDILNSTSSSSSWGLEGCSHPSPEPGGSGFEVAEGIRAMLCGFIS